MSPAQQIVQASHAAQLSGSLYPFDQVPCLVLISISGHLELESLAQHLTDTGIQHSLFREPDLDGQATALCTSPLSGESRRFFRRFQLYRPQWAPAPKGPL